MKLGEAISSEKVILLTSSLKSYSTIKEYTDYIDSELVSNMVLLPNTFSPEQIYATKFFSWIITVELINEVQMHIKITNF